MTGFNMPPGVSPRDIPDSEESPLERTPLELPSPPARWQSGRCKHGIRWPHECSECLAEQVIPDGWCPICGGQKGEHKPGCVPPTSGR